MSYQEEARGRTSTGGSHYTSQQAWECLDVPPGELQMVTGRGRPSLLWSGGVPCNPAQISSRKWAYREFERVI